MPYTEKHQKFVEPLLNLDLDDLNEHSNDLKNELNEIKKALTVNPFIPLPAADAKDQKLDPKELKSKFFTIQRCFHAPEDNLSQLEKISGDITIGDLKTGMLQFIQNHLETIAKKTNIPLEWSPITLVTEISKDSKNEKFFKSPTNREFNSLEIPTPSGVLYNITEVTQNPGTMHFSITINIDLGEDSNISVTRYLGYTNVTTGTFSPYFIKKAQNEAEAVTLEHVIQHLINKKIIDEIEADQIPEGTKKYLVYKFFFQKILKKEMSLWDMYTENPSEAEIIYSSGYKSFLENKQSNLETFRKASPSQLKVIGDPYFHDQLMKNPSNSNDDFSLSSVFKLNDQTCSNLTFPPTLFLLRLEKITIEEAKQMTAAGRKLIAQQFFTEEIERGGVEFKELNKATNFETETLLMPGIQTLLREKMIDIQKAKSLSLEQRNKFSINMVNLIIQKKVSMDQVYKTSPLSAKLISINELIFELLKNDFISFYDVEKILTKTISHHSLGKSKKLFSLMSENQKQLFINFVKDFLILSQHGLLFAEELNFIYSHFSLIANEITMENSPGDAKAENPVMLLRSATIKDHCLKNLNKRINHLIINDPYPMHDNKLDNMVHLEKACSFLSVNLNFLIFEELKDQIRAFYMGYGSLEIEDIIKQAKQCGLSSECVWGTAFAIRALQIYSSMPSVVIADGDSMGRIFDDILSVQNKEHLNENELIIHFLKQLQLLIDEDLDQCAEIETVPVIKQIRQLLTSSLATPQLQFEIFQKIFAATHQALDSSRLESYRSPTEGSRKRLRDDKTSEPSSKRSRISLFDFKETREKNEVASLRLVYRNLLRFEPLIEKLSKHLHAPTLGLI